MLCHYCDQFRWNSYKFQIVIFKITTEIHIKIAQGSNKAFGENHTFDGKIEKSAF